MKNFYGKICLVLFLGIFNLQSNAEVLPWPFVPKLSNEAKRDFNKLKTIDFNHLIESALRIERGLEHQRGQISKLKRELHQCQQKQQSSRSSQ